ncbi:uncharacterized protein CMU_006660 [Cryptosporidium muris RN66]|uniref:Uncharacterized protein n=1 Tax=Cryptosporidium muris (strain RN66) TaxID=441375 RepID=B6AHP8_CRYMR|nr:uncharacterized protein CMU_006660 [Cryptosporidium muris RN66]EEA07743.1 hypothetical protein, conserved [Cryptosporidium muris RN66]|eukprot:XP_002142092.1 hypothetical protein [Cryptosporidium muris RN66]
MQYPRSIVEHLDKLIKQAKALSESSYIDGSITRELDSNKLIGIDLLQNRRNICMIQKSTMEELIQLYQEELKQLQSALRSIEEEERRIEISLARENMNLDNGSAATRSLELIERDTVRNWSIEELEEFQISQANDEINKDNLNINYNKDENIEDSSGDIETSTKNLPPILPLKGKTKGKKEARWAITIPQRYNYMRNRHTSQLKDISIKQILAGRKEPEIEQKDIVRELHKIYNQKEASRNKLSSRLALQF